MSRSHRSLCVLFSRTDAGLCTHHLFVWSKLNFLHISQWITLPTQSCLVLYSFCTNFLHSLIVWLVVSSLSPHSVHLLFCYVLSILALIWWVLAALFCAAIRKDSVSLLRFPFLSHASSNQRWLMIFHWSLSGSKSPLVSRARFCILTDLNNVVIWINIHRLVKIRLSDYISKSLRILCISYYAMDPRLCIYS